MDALKDLLVKLRGDRSLRDIAEISGISHNYLRLLELGKDPRSGKPTRPSPDTLKALSKAYNYPYEEMMIVAGYLDRDQPTISEEDRKKAEIEKSLRSLVAHDEGEFPISNELINTIYDAMMKGRKFHTKKKEGGK